MDQPDNIEDLKKFLEEFPDPDDEEPIPLGAGMNEEVILRIKNYAATMKPNHKGGFFLIWREQTLQAHVNYSSQQDYMVGFQDLGESRRCKKFADQALVFMIRSLSGKKKQPIAYYLIESPIEANQIVSCIKEIYLALQSAGIHIRATICNQSLTNIAAVKLLHGGNAMRESYEITRGKELIHIYDTPHLLKTIRNHLVDKKLQFDGNNTDDKKFASWDHIITLYEDPSLKSKVFKKINDTYIYKNVINKTKVNVCTRVFSEKVSSCMRRKALSKEHPLPENATDTADLLLFFSRLFDSLNGSFSISKSCKANRNRIVLTQNSYHHKLWADAIPKLKSMRFISGDSNESFSVPTLDCWIKTIQSFQLLWKSIYTSSRVKFFRTRAANLDPLENFLAAIRIHSKSKTPTPMQFVISFNHLVMKNELYKYSEENNCEDDGGYPMLNMKYLNPWSTVRDDDNDDYNPFSLKPLHDFFDEIRAHAGRKKPTVKEFQRAYSHLVMKDLMSLDPDTDSEDD